MTGVEERASWRRRFTTAVAVVTAIVLAAPVSDAALSATGAASGQVSETAAIRASDLLGGPDANAALVNIEQLAQADEADEGPPAACAEEIGVLPDARDVRASGSVIGYVVDCESSEALDALRAHMEQRGWSSVPIGGVEGATFLKDSGRYTWALATCLQVGDAASIVVRFA